MYDAWCAHSNAYEFAADGYLSALDDFGGSADDAYVVGAAA